MRRILNAGLAVLLSNIPSIAAADPIHPVQDRRFVSANIDVPGGAHADRGPGDHLLLTLRAGGAAVTTSLNSDIGDLAHMRAHGRGSVEPNAQPHAMYAIQTFAGKFALDAPLDYTLTGAYNTSSAFGVALYRYTLVSPSEGFIKFFPVFLTPGDFVHGTGTIAAHGHLIAGLYDLSVINEALVGYANLPQNTTTKFDFAFDLLSSPAAVPEPSSFPLLAAAAIAILRRRRLPGQCE